MNNQNISFSLDCDDDVVSFEKETLKVSQLKEVMIVNTRENLESPIDYLESALKDEEESHCKYIKFDLTLELQIVDCEILQINGKGWQKGKLNLKICISLRNHLDDKINLEFFPEQSIKPESPLDDIHEMVQTN